MKHDKIEPYQGLLLCVALCFGGLGAASPIGGRLGHDIWLIMLPAGLVGLLLFGCCSVALKRCQSRDLAEITLSAWGWRWGRVVLAVYLAFFLFAASYYLWAILNLWKLMDMRHTPLVVFVLLALLLCVLLARMGLTVIGRASMFFVLFYLLITLIDTLFLLPELQWQRMLPLRWPDTKLILEDGLYMAVLMFGLLPLALLFLPRLSRPAKARSCLIWGMALIFAELLWANLRNVFLFGDALAYEDYPTYQALRLVEWGSGIVRMDLFGVLAALMMVFLFGSLAFYGMGRLMAAISGRKGENFLWPLAAISASIMLLMEQAVSFVDDIMLLLALSCGSLLIWLLLLITILMLQKSDCQTKENDI